MRISAKWAIILAFVIATPGLAAETITYSYDALGQLVSAAHSGGVNDGQSVAATYDAAGNRTNYTVNGVAAANLAIGDASATEGGNLVFTVTRSGNTGLPVSVDFATADGTATSYSDFTSASGTVNFASNQTTATVTVTTTDDAVFEPTESMTVTLSNASAGAAITTATGTGTINDNDQAYLDIANAAVAEGGDLVFTVTRSGNIASAITANYATADGTALAGSDYTAASGTVNFNPYQTTATVTVATIDDTAVESPENMTATLSGPSSGGAINTATGTGTINDNDVAPANLAIGNSSVTEGNNLVFTVTRSGNTATAVTVDYATTGGTATPGSDFTTASGTVSFAASQTTATITVATIDDTAVESAETMTVTLSNPSSSATIIIASGTGTINDNDVAPANLAIGNASATEGGNLTFTVTRSGNTASAVTANYATASGTATSGSDFTAGSGAVSFAASQTTATITVATINDTAVESTEAMTVTLSGASSGATITTATGTGTITDNDAGLAIGNATVSEGGTLTFTVTRTGVTTGTASASYATASGTATSGSDFTAKSGTVSFAAGQTTATITVVTIDDTAVESAETLTVTLSGAVGATITTATGTGTINDNDAGLAIGSASVTEGGTMTFTVTRTGVTTGTASASYATANGTATAGSDYTAKTGTVSFAAGQTTATITVVTIDDTAVESAETLTVTLSGAVSATITIATGTGTINENDVGLAIGNAAAVEGGILTFTVTRSGNTAAAVGVNYATANGTALPGTDYTTTSGTLSFTAGQVSKTISVATVNDTIHESTETMSVGLSAPTGGAQVLTATGTGTITDND